MRHLSGPSSCSARIDGCTRAPRVALISPRDARRAKPRQGARNLRFSPVRPAKPVARVVSPSNSKGPKKRNSTSIVDELPQAEGLSCRVRHDQWAPSAAASGAGAARARIVLLAAQGPQNEDIAELLGIGRVQVARWRLALERAPGSVPGVDLLCRRAPRGPVCCPGRCRRSGRR